MLLLLLEHIIKFIKEGVTKFFIDNILKIGLFLAAITNIYFLFIFKTSKNQIKVDLVDENFTELRGEIAGPPDTPYEGKYFFLYQNIVRMRTYLKH